MYKLIDQLEVEFDVLQNGTKYFIKSIYHIQMRGIEESLWSVWLECKIHIIFKFNDLTETFELKGLDTVYVRGFG